MQEGNTHWIGELLVLCFHQLRWDMRFWKWRYLLLNYLQSIHELCPYVIPFEVIQTTQYRNGFNSQRLVPNGHCHYRALL